jgi:hypothetical protein
MMSDEWCVTSINPETQEVSVDTYESKSKAERMLDMFQNDFPDRNFYLGKKVEK